MRPLSPTVRKKVWSAGDSSSEAACVDTPQVRRERDCSQRDAGAASSAQWRVDLREDIYVLHEVALLAAQGGTASSVMPMSRAQLVRYLGVQDEALCDDPVVLRLQYTETLLSSMSLAMKCHLEAANGPVADMSPAHTLRCLLSHSTAAAPKPSGAPPASQASRQLQDRVSTLERINTEQKLSLHENMERMRGLEQGRQQLEDQIASLSFALAEESQKVHQLKTCLRGQAKDPKGSGACDDAPPRSGLHRLFSGPQRTASLSNAPPQEDTPAEVTLDEVLCRLEATHPGLAEVDKQQVARSVLADVTQCLQNTARGHDSVVSTFDTRVKRMRSVIQSGVELAKETQQKTGQLTERCRKLERDADEKAKRIAVLEGHLDNVEGGRQATEGTVARLQRMLDAADERSDSFDSFIGDELKSLRDAFSIKLALANDEIDLMQKRHQQQLHDLQAASEREKGALRQTIHTLQGRLHSSV